MLEMVLIGVVVGAAIALAFANGANDNAKGVATLIGSGLVKIKPAVVYAAVTTAMGSVAAIWIGAELASKFKGKGIVADAIWQSGSFAACVGLAAGGTVLLATRLALPISTTHAMVGSIIGIGAAGGGLEWAAVWKKFFYPLMASPFIALALAALLYLLFTGIRRLARINRETCLCVGQEVVPLSIGGDGTLAMASTGVTLTADQAEQCEQRYTGRFLGISAQTVLDRCHFLTAGAVSFARGLNDTPKVAALMIGLSFMTDWQAVVVVGIGIAAGGLLAVRRVAQTMSHRITGMNDGQAFTANLNTAFLVIVASKWGVPVSTTHVSCGSLIGIGAVSGQGRWKMIVTIVLAWVATLPVAAVLGALCWTLLG
ncbi:PiT family inorganic phosphate transporter [Algisphaera agarilytica]|uniref:Phosphate transporter n=2 Tax=Algisphaera agarilytica TaxID=1385975 RepID=A0A7X0H849_9BACT|nr:PiT family inorganic phosphate transporter [Algisphaera agarilytica]